MCACPQGSGCARRQAYRSPGEGGLSLPVYLPFVRFCVGKRQEKGDKERCRRYEGSQLSVLPPAQLAQEYSRLCPQRECVRNGPLRPAATLRHPTESRRQIRPYVSRVQISHWQCQE